MGVMLAYILLSPILRNSRWDGSKSDLVIDLYVSLAQSMEAEFLFLDAF